MKKKERLYKVRKSLEKSSVVRRRWMGAKVPTRQVRAVFGVLRVAMSFHWLYWFWQEGWLWQPETAVDWSFGSSP